MENRHPRRKIDDGASVVRQSIVFETLNVHSLRIAAFFSGCNENCISTMGYTFSAARREIFHARYVLPDRQGRSLVQNLQHTDALRPH